MTDNKIKTEYVQSFLEDLKTDFGEYKRPYSRIAFRLAEAQRNGYASILGYTDIYDLADQEVGLKSTSTKNYIAFFNAYMSGWDICECWRNYSFTALIEMLSINSSERRLIKPEMSVKDIRSWKKNHRLVEIDGEYKLFGELTDKEKVNLEKRSKNCVRKSTDSQLTAHDLVDALIVGFDKYLVGDICNFYAFASFLIDKFNITPKG